MYISIVHDSQITAGGGCITLALWEVSPDKESRRALLRWSVQLLNHFTAYL